MVPLPVLLMGPWPAGGLKVLAAEPALVQHQICWGLWVLQTLPPPWEPEQALLLVWQAWFRTVSPEERFLFLFLWALLPLCSPGRVCFPLFL